LIRQVSKFFILFILILIFIYFKNHIKILNNEINLAKSNYEKELQLYLKREIQLTKMVNQIQIEDLKNQYVDNQDVIQFDRNTLNDYTLIKVNYDKSQ
jgi:predicted Holliday junction resolvase-like endonuclease